MLRKTKADDGDVQAANALAAVENDMKNKKGAIEALKTLFVTMKEEGLGRGEQPRHWTGYLGTSDHWQ